MFALISLYQWVYNNIDGENNLINSLLYNHCCLIFQQVLHTGLVSFLQVDQKTVYCQLTHYDLTHILIIPIIKKILIWISSNADEVDSFFQSLELVCCNVAKLWNYLDLIRSTLIAIDIRWEQEELTTKYEMVHI